MNVSRPSAIQKSSLSQLRALSEAQGVGFQRGFLQALE